MPLPTPQLTRLIPPKATTPPDADNAPPNTLDFRSSDQTLDRYDEILTVAGWRLDNYRKNPVVQNAHSYCSLADTIGKSLITEVRGDHLFQRIQFAVDENPMARLAYKLYKGGYLNAVSVGFIPLRWENGNPEAGYRRKYLEQELLEVSVVSIPANPNALTLAFQAGAIQRSDLLELIALLEGFQRGPSEFGQFVPPHSSPPGASHNPPQPSRFPLLRGEGQGEGEATARSPHSSPPGHSHHPPQPSRFPLPRGEGQGGGIEFHFNSTSTGCPGRKSAASAGENFASIMKISFERFSRLYKTGGVNSASVEM